MRSEISHDIVVTVPWKSSIQRHQKRKQNAYYLCKDSNPALHTVNLVCKEVILTTAPLAQWLKTQVEKLLYIHEIPPSRPGMLKVDASSASRQPPHSGCAVAQSIWYHMKWSLISYMMTNWYHVWYHRPVCSICSAAAFSSPRCSGLAATLPRLYRPQPALPETLPYWSLDGEEPFASDLHFSRVVTVFTDVVLQNAFALCENIGCIHIQWRKVYSLLHRPGWNHHLRLLGNVLQELLNVSCVHARGQVLNECRKILDIFLHVPIHAPSQNPLVGQPQDRCRLHQHADLGEAQPPLLLQGIYREDKVWYHLWYHTKYHKCQLSLYDIIYDIIICVISYMINYIFRVTVFFFGVPAIGIIGFQSASLPTEIGL